MPSSVWGTVNSSFFGVEGAVTMPFSVLGLLPQVSSVGRAVTMSSSAIGLLPQLSIVWGSCYLAFLQLLGLLPHVYFVGRAVTTPSSVSEAVA